MSPLTLPNKNRALELIAPCALAIPVGIAVGTIDALFGRTLLMIGSFRSEHVWLLAPLLPLAGLLIVFLYQRLGKNTSRGMGLVFDVGHGTESKIPLRLVPLIMSTTWLTHLFGGSAGREGVAVQIGATISHWAGSCLGEKAHTLKHDNIFLVAGMAAGFAGLFRTPIAATLFALEVLHVGKIELKALMPSLIAAFCASGTSGALGLEMFRATVATPLEIDAALFTKTIFLGIIFGVVGAAFARLLAIAKCAAAARFASPYQRILILGIGISLATLLLFQGRYSGLGTNLIAASLTDNGILAGDWLAKLLLTVATLAAGYQGGEVTPLFSIGASLGCALAPLFGMNAGLAAALGYAAVFGSATSTLLAPILIGGEVFGFQTLPLFFIACSAARAWNFGQTIYPGQKH